MISNGFDIPKTFYVTSRFVADLTNTDLDLYKQLKDFYGVRRSGLQISEVIEMKDEDYTDPRKASTSILRQCLMRSAFLFMSDETILEMNSSFHDFVESDEYLERHPYDKISEEQIINCFKAVKRDRAKPSVLSLAFRRQ